MTAAATAAPFQFFLQINFLFFKDVFENVFDPLSKNNAILPLRTVVSSNQNAGEKLKKTILLLCAIAFLHLFSCNQDGGWIDLFNGTDLEGWEVKGASESNFYVEDGILVAETKMGIPNTFLATTKSFANFFGLPRRTPPFS